jgi:hypothetical protein
MNARFRADRIVANECQAPNEISDTSKLLFPSILWRTADSPARYLVFSKISRPISMRRISLVPAPIS